MHGSSRIHHHPYFPPTRVAERNAPYICRIAPFENGFTFDWLVTFDADYTVCYSKKGTEEWHTLPISGGRERIENLATDCEYAFYVTCDGISSRTRYVRTGAIPAGTTVINYLHPEDDWYDCSGHFLCSPSIVRLDNGRIIASMDLFGPEMPQNLTLLFYSDDNGNDWHYLNDLYPFYWGSLFVHHGVLYILGLTMEYGNLQIAASYDGGVSWTAPTTIFYGSNILCRYGGVHRAPMHFTAFNGRLYTSMEYGCWRAGSHLPTVLSIDDNADLLQAENWVCAPFLPFEGKWKTAAEKQGDTMEGNITVYNGEIYNIMRWKTGELLQLKADKNDPEKQLSFDCITGAPVSNSMFRVIPHKDYFLLVTNRKTEIAARIPVGSYRNVLSIYKTYDFKDFTFVKDVINAEQEDAGKVGFQYPSFIKEEDTLYLAIRSAFNNADNFHNSNHILFYKTTI